MALLTVLLLLMGVLIGTLLLLLALSNIIASIFVFTKGGSRSFGEPRSEQASHTIIQSAIAMTSFLSSQLPAVHRLVRYTSLLLLAVTAVFLLPVEILLLFYLYLSLESEDKREIKRGIRRWLSQRTPISFFLQNSEEYLADTLKKKAERGDISQEEVMELVQLLSREDEAVREEATAGLAIAAEKHPAEVELAMSELLTLIESNSASNHTRAKAARSVGRAVTHFETAEQIVTQLFNILEQERVWFVSIALAEISEEYPMTVQSEIDKLLNLLDEIVDDFQEGRPWKGTLEIVWTVANIAEETPHSVESAGPKLIAILEEIVTLEKETEAFGVLRTEDIPEPRPYLHQEMVEITDKIPIPIFIYEDDADKDVDLWRTALYRYTFVALANIAKKHPDAVRGIEDITNSLQRHSDGNEELEEVLLRTKHWQTLPSYAILLIPLLYSKDADIRADAALGLANIAEEYPSMIKLTDLPIRVMLTDKDYRVRKHTTRILANLAEEYPEEIRSMIPELTTLLQEKSKKVREYAAETLSHAANKSPEAVRTSLLPLLSKDEKKAKRSAALAFATIAETHPETLFPIISDLIKILEAKSDDVWVQAYSAAALSKATRNLLTSEFDSVLAQTGYDTETQLEHPI